MSAPSSTAPVAVAPTTTPSAPKVRSRFSVGRTLKYLVLLFFLVVVLIPVYVLVVTSFKGPGDAAAVRAWNLPEVWVLDNWKGAWDALSPALWRTIQMVVPWRYSHQAWLFFQ